MFALLITLFSSFTNFHTPHDDVHGVATAHLPNGVVETVITTSRASQVLRTIDEGLSWQPVFGDGLELARADTVTWDPNPATPRFIIGTGLGFWSYYPLTGVVETFNDGLPAALESRFPCQVAVSSESSGGQIFMVNKVGQIWGYSRASSKWVLAYDSGIVDPRAQIAVVPSFDPGAPIGSAQTLLASVAGILFFSDDGGQQWRKHPQFKNQAVQADDRLITAIAFADDYETSGNIVLATSVPMVQSFSGDQGTLWHSGDYGATFQPVAQYNTSIRTLTSTPVGPSGQQWFLGSALTHPSHLYLGLSVGIIRSLDGGVAWDDYGTAQDFIQEVDSGATVLGGRSLIHDFEVSPDFATSGRIIFGRSEGLYYTDNEGLRWIRRTYRPSAQVRSVVTVINPAGELVAYTGGYGTGTLSQNLVTGAVNMLADGPNNYVNAVRLSPNFNEDGMLIVGGSRGPAFWYNPELGAPNTHNVLGWKAVPLNQHLGYVRPIAFSPKFDARGVPGSDQVFFFATSSEMNTNFVSRDGGRSVTVLDKLTDGSTVQYFRHIAIAPTYDSSITTGPADVYGSHGMVLYRLNGHRWDAVQTFSGKIKNIALASDFDRDPLTPGLPRIFVATQAPPYFSEFIDDYSNPIVNNYPDGLDGGFPVSLACPPDFATSQSVYMATFSSGVKRLDLSQPSPQWTNVGLNFPDLWLSSLSLSPNFAVDRTVVVGTQDGVLKCVDMPGESWEMKKPPILRDNEAPEFNYFQPGLVGNPNFNRTWRWDLEDTLGMRETTDFDFIDTTVSFTGNNGSYVECAEYAGGLQIHSFRGPDCGQMIISVENYWTGAPVMSKTVDFSNTIWKNRTVALNFPSQAVRIRLEASLDPGELIYFDGMTFLP